MNDSGRRGQSSSPTVPTFLQEAGLIDDFTDEQLVRELLKRVGEREDRQGISETPERVVRSWKELYRGYSVDVASLFKCFDYSVPDPDLPVEEGKEIMDGMVVLRGVEFFSTCEHHMLPFFGAVHIGYIPNGKVVGVSKLARVVEAFSRRLQIQERLTREIAEALMTNLQPLGCAVIVEALHFCMVARGVSKQHSKMVTSEMRGVFRSNPAARSEFLELVRNHQ